MHTRRHGVRTGLRALGLAAALVAMSVCSVAAQTLTEKQARQQVPASRSLQIVVADLDFLTDDMRKTIKEEARPFTYYGAFALSPGDPVANRSAVGVANYHSPDAAVRAALADCNARRTSGGPCIVVAQTFPRGYKPGGLTLSNDATDILRGDFRRLDSPKAIAISPSTGSFAFSRGDGTRARSACNSAAAENGAQDCQIVVFDP